MSVKVLLLPRRNRDEDRRSEKVPGPNKDPLYRILALFPTRTSGVLQLAQQEGLPEAEWCYLPNKDGEFEEGIQLGPDSLKRNGYRLPTEAEGEYACRAGTVTSRFYGDSDVLLGNYAWYEKNADERAHLVDTLQPNDLGLFDRFGNVAEWLRTARCTIRRKVRG